MSLPYISVLFLLLSILHHTLPLRAGESQTNTVQIKIVVREGLLIRSGNLSVLLDAFVEERETEGDLALQAVRQDMLTGRPPFSSIQLALVSHPHSEHFDAMTAGTFLKNHPETVLASSMKIMLAIRNEYPDYKMIKNQLKLIKPGKNKVTSFRVPKIRVDFIRFKHEASMFYKEQVLGHVIYIGGRKILYIGDAEMRPENWQPYKLQSQGIDVALVPFWLFKEEITRTIINKYVAPKKMAVVQMSRKKHRKEADDFIRVFPDVVFLNTPMASAVF